MPLFIDNSGTPPARITGELAAGIRSVYVQWRDLTSDPWEPRLGSAAPIAAARARAMIATGPLRHKYYQLVEVSAAPDEKESLI